VQQKCTNVKLSSFTVLKAFLDSKVLRQQTYLSRTLAVTMKTAEKRRRFESHGNSEALVCQRE
jgi:hypothetical protein